MKECVCTRYELLKIESNKIKIIIKDQQIEWAPRKCIRVLSLFQSLEDIQTILESRYTASKKIIDSTNYKEFTATNKMYTDTLPTHGFINDIGILESKKKK